MCLVLLYFSLIRYIFSKYDVFLSQGTVYPLLYSLKEDGVLDAEYIKANMKTKVYSLTEEGMQITTQKINEFDGAVNFVLQSINDSKNKL